MGCHGGQVGLDGVHRDAEFILRYFLSVDCSLLNRFFRHLFV